MPKAKANAAAPEFRTLLELHEGDNAALGRLVQRYQVLLWEGDVPAKSSKIFTIRQLIRYMDTQEDLPPVLDMKPRSPARKTKGKS